MELWVVRRPQVHQCYRNTRRECHKGAGSTRRTSRARALHLKRGAQGGMEIWRGVQLGGPWTRSTNKAGHGQTLFRSTHTAARVSYPSRVSLQDNLHCAPPIADAPDPILRSTFDYGRSWTEFGRDCRLGLVLPGSCVRHNIGRASLCVGKTGTIGTETAEASEAAVRYWVQLAACLGRLCAKGCSPIPSTADERRRIAGCNSRTGSSCASAHNRRLCSQTDCPSRPLAVDAPWARASAAAEMSGCHSTLRQSLQPRHLLPVCLRSEYSCPDRIRALVSGNERESHPQPESQAEEQPHVPVVCSATVASKRASLASV